MTSLVCVAWSLAALSGVGLFAYSDRLVILGAVQLGMVIGVARSWAIARTLLAATVPFLLLLIAFHGLLNPAFVGSPAVSQFLPLRSAGMHHALQIGGLVVTVTALAGAWGLVPRDALVEDLFRLRLPLPLVIVLTQSFALLYELRRRADLVALAQQARGIPISGRRLARLRSLPALLVPMVVGTLVEADARAQVLETRGLGVVPPRPLGAMRVTVHEMFLAALMPAAIVLIPFVT